MLPSFEVDAATAHEVIEGWSRQTILPSLPLDERPLIEVVGYDTVDKLTAPLTEDTIHLMPAMFGGGAVGKILVGGAMIIAGILIAPTNPLLGIGLVTSGIGIAMGGVMELFMKAPKLDAEQDDDTKSKYLGSGRNTTAIGTVIGIGGGRMKVGGQYLSLQVNSSDMVMGRFPANAPA